MPPNLTAALDGLNQSLEALLTELQAYSPAQLNRPPAPESWSALQTAQHLLLSERLSLLYLRKKLQAPPSDLPDKTWHEGPRRLFLKLYLASPLKFKAPPLVATDKLPRESHLADVREQWQQVREELEALLQRLDPAIYDKAVYKHPFLGRFSPVGMLAFLQYHFDHHHRQIRRALQ